MNPVSYAVKRLELDISKSNRGGDGQRVQPEHGPRAPGQTFNISYLQVFGLRRAATRLGLRPWRSSSFQLCSLLVLPTTPRRLPPFL